MVFGNPLVLKTSSPDETEKHVHREMNVWGSGGAHSTYFKVIDQVIINYSHDNIEQLEDLKSAIDYSKKHIIKKIH